MKFILGKKLHMTQLFKDNGTVVPVTVVEAKDCFITQIKTADKNSYTSIQVGLQKTSAKQLTKAQKNHLKKTGVLVKHLREFRVKNQVADLPKEGDMLTVAQFEEGEKVNVIGTSKGRGFQGVVKRHGFHGSPATHGHKDQLRMPGSIGATDAQRVIKGMRMGGHMGNRRITAKNMIIAKVNAQEHKLYIRGALPGSRGGLLKITTV